jgi:hypothetical protein
MSRHMVQLLKNMNCGNLGISFGIVVLMTSLIDLVITYH